MRQLTIGQAARMAAVTAKALRHYDRIGLLRPAAVDPVTGYRRYHTEQIDQARLIRRLRDLDRDALHAALREHRRRIETR
jgi:DNA-binding transcriptional MerR regulator